MADYEKAFELLNEFFQVVDSIYGVYLDLAGDLMPTKAPAQQNTKSR